MKHYKVKWINGERFTYTYYYTVFDTFWGMYVDVLFEYGDGRLAIVDEDGDERVILKSWYRELTTAEEVLFVGRADV